METSFFNFPVYAVPEPQAALAKLQGENQKNLLIVVNSENWGGDEIFLNRIFNAAGVDLAKDALTLASEPAELKPTFSQITSGNKIRYIFMFGVAPLELGLQTNFPMNAPTPWNKRIFYTSASLKEIEAATELKRPLWDFLRAEFLKK